MLSRHWQLWLSFPPSRSLPKSGWRLSRSLLHSWFRLKGEGGSLQDG